MTRRSVCFLCMGVGWILKDGKKVICDCKVRDLFA